VLDVDGEVRPYPEETSRRLWEGHDFPPLPLLDGGVGDGARGLSGGSDAVDVRSAP